jgi:4-alpha-glucanotransferase
VPDDFPLGYHLLHDGDGGTRRLIVSPGRCWLPDQWRAWGLAVQLYAARSRSSWGIGDLADLRALREWLQRAGAGFCMVNPLHAVAPTPQQETSPYLPATRRWRNPLYLRVEEVPGAEGVDLTGAAAAGRALLDEPLVDRDAVWRLKRAALEQVFAVRGRDDRFDGWRSRHGTSLEDFARWCALAEVHGPDWRSWPSEVRRPDGPAVDRFAAQNGDRVAFHAWVQWVLDLQLERASGDLTVVQDLPIGVAGGGADTWAWQDQIAAGVEVGAPPDVFNPRGQKWGSPPFIPWRLREQGYDAFIATIRGTIAGAGGLRIDHVMGLFRLWWVPPGGSPVDGAYVRYPSADMLDIVALESQRAAAIVVGEDLGTVEPGVRETLAVTGLLAYKLLWFEHDDPADWPVSSMAAVTTHDLPTVAGLWTGADLDEQRQLGVGEDDELTQGRTQLMERLMQPTGLDDTDSPGEAVVAAHRLLARAPSTLLVATLEDAVADERRPNMPGTTKRPNWSVPLPVLVDDLESHPTARAVTDLLAAAVPTQGQPGDEP